MEWRFCWLKYLIIASSSLCNLISEDKIHSLILFIPYPGRETWVLSQMLGARGRVHPGGETSPTLQSETRIVHVVLIDLLETVFKPFISIIKAYSS